MGNFRLAIPCLAVLLVLLSVPPLRRRLPGARHLPAVLELLLWLGFVTLCVAALASVRTPRSIELAQAVARAGLDVTGRSIDSVLGPAMHWVAVRQPGVAVMTLSLAGLGWVIVAARAALALRRAIQPHPHLNDWWVVKPEPRARLRIEAHPSPAVEAPQLVDAHAAAQYLGVSRRTVYRWARAGRLRPERAGAQLLFSSGDLAALRETDTPQAQHA